MSTDKSFARFVVYTALVLGAMYAPFAYQDYVWHVCRTEFSTTKQVGNCYWQVMYKSDIYE